MTTIADIGVPGQPLGSPPLTAWQAAVRDAINKVTGGDVWTSWTPSINGGTVSAADCRYLRTPGGLLTFDAHLTIATITGNFSFSLPTAVIPAKSYGTAALDDANGSNYLGITRITGNPAATCGVYSLGTNSAWVPLAPTVPFTWVAGDAIHVTGQYRCAAT